MTTKSDKIEGLGVGLYKPSAVARIAGVPLPRVNRWMKGYSFRSRSGGKRQSDPLLWADLLISLRSMAHALSVFMTSWMCSA